MNTASQAPWHALSTEEVLAALETGTRGLSGEEATARLKQYGPNRLKASPPTSPFKLFLDEFRSPLILVLIASAILLFLVAAIGNNPDQNVDAGLILAIVLFNGILGFIQNYRAHRGIEALKRLTAPMATFLRDGRRVTAETSLLVPGDVVLLEEGDRVPADGRLIEAYDLRLDESALTGESLPVAKTPRPLPEDTSLAERANMVYLGTVVMRGRGRFVVTGTGMGTEVGRIAEAIQTAEERPTQFQREVADLGKRLTTIIALLILLIAVLQLTLGHLTLLETFVTAVALAVAAIPEGLPVVLTLALAFGTRRMLERQALVRSLPVVEILGSAQVICADKTGTITEGRMSLRYLFWEGRLLEVTGGATATDGGFLEQGRPTDQRENLALLAGGLCNNAHRDPDQGFQGDPTEVALLVGAYKAKIDLDAYVRVDEVPFSSERRMMSVVVQQDGHRFVFSKGAPEVIIDRCTRLYTPEGLRHLTEEEKDRLLAMNNQLAGQALRVLALAYKEDPVSGREELEKDLMFLGLTGLSDPPREEAKTAMAVAFRAGIRVVMITGDNRLTATAIAKEVGLEGECVEGRDLDDLSALALEDVVKRVNIFARAEPRQKLRILRALQRQGQVVVMTGDGVNDAPALKGADVGIAMGIRGTDVARDASDMVLLDDNFATIVAAVEEGRRIFANIKKFVNYLLIGNFAEVLVVLVASLFGYLPITAIQILWINLVTDSGPAVALGVDPPAPGLMSQPPRRGGVISRGMFGLIISIGVVKAGIILLSFALGLLFDFKTAQTMTFTAFVVQEYLRLGVLRYQERTSFFANRWLVIAVAVSLALQMVLIYTPVGDLFSAVPLGPWPWLILLGGLVIGFIAGLRMTDIVVRHLGAI
ncbi:MAG: cation-transporting P-type ATPase [candidate division NC10 bacterium]|nr:cation-transporting P-type ATPase [candidate division NC10 bacterium]